MDIYMGRLIKLSLVFICLLLSSQKSYCQAKEATDTYSKKGKGFRLDPDRIVIGGGFGAQFGNVTLLELSPTVGYLVKENWLVGVGGRYIYFEEKTPFFTYKTNIYGANVFTQYFLFENFLAHVEYELLNTEDFYAPSKRTNISSFFVGGGYRSMIGANSFASFLLLYNLNDDINSPYTNPIIRVSFGIGL